MALTSVFYDGVVTETDRAKNLAGSPEYGVYGIDDFKVTAHPSIPYNVLVKAGRAHGHGVTDEAAIDQIVPCDTLATGARWDLIAVRRNWQPALGGPSTLVAITAGATAEIPAARKVGPGVEDDQPIALVKWKGGLSAPETIIDLRVWAGNGGLYAKDDLVRTYLTRVGTEVNINGALWVCSLGANGTTTWDKASEVGKVPLFGVGGSVTGGAPPTGAQFLVQTGSKVGTTDTQGYANVVFPKAFPNGLLYVGLSNGDSSIDRAYGRGTLAMNPSGAPYDNGTKTQVTYTVAFPTGLAPGLVHRVNWIAIGW
ncbi:hypothetical protein ACFVWT_04280 [Arthrobacter sp. NPDC058288]|uniref:hypothetical protein n=1 Tax=Arthrobacter sp. NPDC058288 TaxID=3346424 RepID=UPI0036E833B8